MYDLQLERLRVQAGFKKRRDLADALDDISERQIKAWELGQRHLKLADACKIADILGCTLDELAGREFDGPAYSDPYQAELNEAYEQCVPDGKLAILMNARGQRELSLKVSERSEPAASATMMAAG